MPSSLSNRLNRVVGQIQGIQKMLSSEQDCEKVAIQFKAVKSAWDNAFREFLREHMAKCVRNKDEDSMNKILDMVVK